MAPTLLKQWLLALGFVMSTIQLRRCFDDFIRPPPLPPQVPTAVANNIINNDNVHHQQQQHQQINKSNNNKMKKNNNKDLFDPLLLYYAGHPTTFGRRQQQQQKQPAADANVASIETPSSSSTSSSSSQHQQHQISLPTTPTASTASTSTTSTTSTSTLLSLFGMERVDRSKRLEFIHITKTGGSAVEMGAAAAGVQWGACHYMKVPYLGCHRPADWEFPMGLGMPAHMANKTHNEPWHSPPHWLVPNPQPKDRIANFVVVRDPYQRLLSEFIVPPLVIMAPSTRKH